MRARMRKPDELRATPVARRAAAAFALLVCCGAAALAQAGSSLAEPPGERFGEAGEIAVSVDPPPEVAVPAPSPEVVEPTPAFEPEPADEPSPFTFGAAPRAAPADTEIASPPPPPARRAHARASAAPTPALPKRPVPAAPSRPAPQPVFADAPTYWIPGALPDPLPPSSRLSRGYARRIVRTAHAARVDWPLLLAALRVRSEVVATPAGPVQLRRLARRLSRLDTRPDRRRALLALSSDPERALALASLYRAVGLHGLVKGREASKPRLTGRLLRDPDVALYPGGREDLAAGRIDVRVLALLGYLAEEFGQVGVTSLQAGHRIYARPGVVSAHVFGLAVDIASVGGVPVAGSQGPGEQTERLLRSILLLPAELRPRQVISLIGLGGPSFALFDHDDHVHVGY